MERRAFLARAGAVLLAAALAAEAQLPAKVPRLGFLTTTFRTASPHLWEAFLQGLRDLGYVEGRNVVIEYRDAERKLERLPALAAWGLGGRGDTRAERTCPSEPAHDSGRDHSQRTTRTPRNVRPSRPFRARATPHQ